MEKRLISALALSVLVILAFQYFTVKPPAQPTVPIDTAQVTAQLPKEESLAMPKTSDPMVAEKETIVETDQYIIPSAISAGQ